MNIFNSKLQLSTMVGMMIMSTVYGMMFFSYLFANIGLSMIFTWVQLKYIISNDGVIPNGFTFVCVLKSCGVIGATNKVLEMHSEIVHQRMVETDIVVGNTLVDVYAKCDCVVNMKQAFNEIPVKDVVSWTTLISGYLEHGYGEEALSCFDLMQSEGVTPNALTYVCGLKACSSIGSLSMGETIHAEVAKKGLLRKNIVLGTALVDMYVKCGFLTDAEHIFFEMNDVNVVTWTVMVAAYAENGCYEQAIDCLELMEHNGVHPNSVTILSCLKVCCTEGSIALGRKLHLQTILEGFEIDLCIGDSLVGGGNT